MIECGELFLRFAMKVPLRIERRVAIGAESGDGGNDG